MTRPTRAIATYLRLRPTLIAVAVLIALWLPGVNQGWYRTDTHFYAAIAKQAWDTAASTGDWAALFDLRAGSEPYMNKPPLVFIIHGACIRAFGLDLWTVRLPSLVASLIAAAATVSFMRRLSGWRAAMMSGLVLATSVEFFRYGRAISLDLWQCAFVMLAIAFVVRGLGTRLGAVRLGWVIASGVPLGCALLCKPFVALLAPVLLGAWVLTEPSLRPRRGQLLAGLILSMLVAAAVAAPWHLWMFSRHGEGFINIYIRQQSLDRALGTPDSPGAAEPWWYYLRVIGEGYWPWLVTLAIALVTIIRTPRAPDADARRTLRLAALWSSVWLLLLSTFGGKSPRYTVIIWPLLAAVSGWVLVRMGQGASGTPRRISRQVMFWFAPLVLAASIIISISMHTGVLSARMHKPRHSAWDQILARTAEFPDRQVVCAPTALAISANLVMLGRPWPPVLADSAAPAKPTWIILDPKQRKSARTDIRVAIESDEVILGEIVP